MPIVPETRLSFRDEKNSRGRKTGKVEAILKDAKGEEVMVMTSCEKKEEALEDLLTYACHSIQALNSLDSSLHVIRFRDVTVIIYPIFGGQWTFAEIKPFHTEKECAQTYISGCSHYSTQYEAERKARIWLAETAWNKKEETSPIITHPRDQQDFTEYTQKAKHRRFLLDQGWSEEEAYMLMNPLSLQHGITQKRIDEMPPLPEWVPYPKEAIQP